jgi:hypothetical protein
MKRVSTSVLPPGVKGTTIVIGRVGNADWADAGADRRTGATDSRPRIIGVRMIQAKGRLGWQKAVGYGRRSLGETAMFRYKTIIGRSLCARTLPAQRTEARVACSVLNRMTRLGMPVSQRIA